VLCELAGDGPTVPLRRRWPGRGACWKRRAMMSAEGGTEQADLDDLTAITPPSWDGQAVPEGGVSVPRPRQSW
jgi:hypothetical protein